MHKTVDPLLPLKKALKSKRGIPYVYGNASDWGRSRATDCHPISDSPALGANYVGCLDVDLNIFLDIERLVARLASNKRDELIVLITPVRIQHGLYSFPSRSATQRARKMLLESGKPFAEISLKYFNNYKFSFLPPVQTTGQVIIRLISLLTDVRSIEYQGFSLEEKSIQGFFSVASVDYSQFLTDAIRLGFSLNSTQKYRIVIGSDKNQSSVNRGIENNIRSVFGEIDLLFTHQLANPSLESATAFTDHRLKFVGRGENILYVDSDVIFAVDSKYYVDYFFEYAPIGIFSSRRTDKGLNLGVLFSKDAWFDCKSLSDLEDGVRPSLGERFNSLDYIDRSTLILHYTRIPSQPWRFPLHHLYGAWVVWTRPYSSNFADCYHFRFGFLLADLDMFDYFRRAIGSIRVIFALPKNIAFIFPFSFLRSRFIKRFLLLVEYRSLSLFRFFL